MCKCAPLHLAKKKPRKEKKNRREDPASALTHTRSFASSVYTSGADDISREFGVSQTESLLGLSLFLWALGLGAIIAAPVSEYYGRRIVYLTTVPVFGLFILGSGLAQNFATLAVCRTLAGFFGSAVVSVGGGTNADLWPPALTGFVYPFYFVSPFLGPAFGMIRPSRPPSSRYSGR
jgi:MFS family permease